MVEKKAAGGPAKPTTTAAVGTKPVIKPATIAAKPEDKKTAPAPPTPTAAGGKRPSQISTAPKVMKGKKKVEEESAP